MMDKNEEKEEGGSSLIFAGWFDEGEESFEKPAAIILHL
jgi:hypothetical protein